MPGWYGLFAILPAYVIAAILLIPILRNRSEGQLQAIALAILGFLYIGWMFGHLAFLANAKDAYGYLLYLIFAVESQRRCGLHLRQALWPPSAAEQHQPEEDLGRVAGGAGRVDGPAVGC